MSQINLTIDSPDKKQTVLITRKRLVNGGNYHYYLTLMNNSSQGNFIINENYKQTKDIQSKKAAIAEANFILKIAQ